MIRTPETTIATATKQAAIASNAGSSVISTNSSPARTPSEVRASARRCAASPSSAGESSASARRLRKDETARLATIENAITAMPTPRLSISDPVTSRRVAS